MMSPLCSLSTLVSLAAAPVPDVWDRTYQLGHLGMRQTGTCGASLTSWPRVSAVVLTLSRAHRPSLPSFLEPVKKSALSNCVQQLEVSAAAAGPARGRAWPRRRPGSAGTNVSSRRRCATGDVGGRRTGGARPARPNMCSHRDVRRCNRVRYPRVSQTGPAIHRSACAHSSACARRRYTVFSSKDFQRLCSDGGRSRISRRLHMPIIEGGWSTVD